MASTHCFVEWKEQFVSKERGNRVVHYFLKDITGESILAVVGTERSVRHMFYVVSEEFVNVHGKENWIYAGFRWRSRREVVNWLTSMLSKHHRTKSPKNDLKSGVGSQEIHMPEYKGCVVRSLKGHTTDIVWSGIAWTCGKQLKHYPSFCRNGIKIGTQSFVYVMAEEDSRYLAYVEDMYEDRKCQRKVKVRWFHHNREVKGVVSVKNSHPKEVFITPYAQVISAECVDGPAIVLTSEHYEKCLTVFPDDVLSRIHICFRQFKNNRVKPFKLSKFRGYFDQPIFSCFGPDFFEDDEVFGHDDNVKHGAKRSRTCRGRQNSAIESSYQKLKDQPWNNASTPFNVNERVEILPKPINLSSLIHYAPISHTLRFPSPPPPPPQMAAQLGFTITTPRFLTAPFRKPFISFSSSPPSKVQSIQFVGSRLSLRRRLLILAPKATTDQPGQVQEDDNKILEYCSLDKKKKSLGEMEQEFLQALQAFYYEGKAIMSNEEFDNLKEELMWEGSSVVMLSADEQRFLEASMAYVAGKPILSDEEFDKLKIKLKMDGSEIVAEGPRCSLRSRKVYSDLTVDYLKMFLLNVPAAIVALTLFFFLDDITGFEITYLLELPEPFSFIFTWFAALPLILWLSFSITNLIVKDVLILKGPCPNCGTENLSFFGTILSISNGGSTNNIKCSNCGTELVYDSSSRLITLPEGSNA